MKKVNFEINNGIAILGVNRPEALNALNREIVDELDDYTEKIRVDDSIRVLVIHSEKNFAAGADIKSMAVCNEEEAKAFTFSPTYDKIEALCIPTIAVMEGYALGGGLELALSCDMRFSSEDAKMGFPEITLGIMPGAGGTIRAPRLIGPAKAKELILSGEIIDAPAALRIGLINRVYPSASLLEESIKFAEKLAKRAPIAMKTAKKTIQTGLHTADSKEGLIIETANWISLFNTEDQKEGMLAFIEKRKPVYKGK